jgi:signal transduction histidine kinase/DNA-binding response OmpR family regulator
MQTSTKKEVSNRGLQGLLDSLEEIKFDENILLQGIPYDIAYLKDKRERIEWTVFCKIISNLRPHFTFKELEIMNGSMVTRGKYFEGILFSFFLFGTNKIARLFHKQIWKLGESMFSCINQKTEFLDKNRLRVSATIDEGYEFPFEFGYFVKGVWDQQGKLIGRKGFKVEFTHTKRFFTFIVSWDKEDIFFRIARVFRWFFNIRKALFEVTNTHAELLQRYDQLQESKQILEKQTTQLKTAYELSTSIKQTLSIKDTLETITNTLINEAGFSAVQIELFKDIDENEFIFNVQSGIITELITPVHRKIIVNERHIGNLITYPNPLMDYEAVNELVDYLTPVINIAIYNALVLRAIIDYRDNLENKVAERTIDLQTASDKLAESNELLKEAHAVQNQFFTNISHEFRTPLTLILGPSKQLLDVIRENSAREQLTLIHRSARKLNRLVDELLDISKIEAGEMKLRACPANLVSVVKELALSFCSLAERKKICLNIIPEENEIIVYIDKDKFDKIITNVLSNAVKFTPEGGSVDLVIRRNKMNAEVVVSDSGIGIPKEQLDKIFDRFFQVYGGHTREYEGTGIGLSLTKELIDLHKGKIVVESEEGRGTTFKLIFPLGKDHLHPDEICEEELEQDKNELKELNGFDDFFRQKLYTTYETESTGKPVLLIVEDNPDVRKYITIILGEYYQIIEAEDGEDGLKKSFEQIPDLIISDIMMPKLDGFKMCNILKSDERTSHIPIIMLTAKATIEDKISGLEFGADDYIMKPFDAPELKARIKNLLEQRKRLHDHFRKYGLVDTEVTTFTPADQMFLRKAVDLISKHISDPQLSVQSLAESIGMSRSLLVRKTEALFGEPPNELIRRIRLNKAAKLLERKIGNVSEIALEVGFNNPSYFAECFKKQFGVTPSQFSQDSKEKD